MSESHWPEGVATTDYPDEFVVLVDERGRPCGRARKAVVHHEHTPLHLGFSCWVTDAAGRILITRRALSKQTWPGVWTNAFCGHPAPGELPAAAVLRRAREELGVSITAPRLALPRFRYHAVMDNGIAEHEVCPVFVAELLGDPVPMPDEVADMQWVTLDGLCRRIGLDKRWFSPWAVRQLTELTAVWPDFGRVASPTPGRQTSRSPGMRYRDFLGHRPLSPSARTILRTPAEDRR